MGARTKRLLRDLVKLAALVLVAGGVGVALGIGLSQLSDDGESAPRQTVAATPATTTTAPANPLAQVGVNVLDARLFTDETPSGREQQRARLTVRIRAENAGSRRVTLPPPILRVGRVRLPTDASSVRFDPFAAGTSQTATLRFSLTGEATPKVVRDRRARLLIAGQSVPMRVKVRGPTR